MVLHASMYVFVLCRSRICEGNGMREGNKGERIEREPQGWCGSKVEEGVKESKRKDV